MRRGRSLPHAQAAHLKRDGPGEHDGAGRVQGDGRAAWVPRNALNRPFDGVDREHREQPSRKIDQISRTKFDEASARINENSGVGVLAAFPGRAGTSALTDQENSAESGAGRLWPRLRGKKLQNSAAAARAARSQLTALALLVGIFQFQPSPFCALDEVDAGAGQNKRRPSPPYLLHSLSKETQFLLGDDSRSG